ncbi:MAG TPA: hypothetical protein VNT77_05005 [Allosphingosinicella sp.]|nr:hypothetical protein [Allosphingosinicella sp.]
MDELGNVEKQEVGRWLNNRVENSHLPFRRRERATVRFRKMKTLQKFSSVCPGPQPLQPGTTSHRQTYLQSSPLGRTGRVAISHGLNIVGAGESCLERRQVRIRLTARSRA